MLRENRRKITLMFSTTFLVRLVTYCMDSCIAAGGFGTNCRMFSTRFTNGLPGGGGLSLSPGLNPAARCTSCSCSSSPSPYKALSRNSFACNSICVALHTSFLTKRKGNLGKTASRKQFHCLFVGRQNNDCVGTHHSDP